MIINCLIRKPLLKCFINKNFRAVTPYCSSSQHPGQKSRDITLRFKLTDETTRLLEKLALVNFENHRNVNVVESAIEFANSINSVNTDNIEPLVTVLENRYLKLREDLVTDKNLKEQVLQNAAIVEEDYFVAPPGNIPVNLQSLKSS
ncbi:glutamyl-tRNA(Gln) amidotransferase subunit C, mitochondrial [Planococcus citri]|uniref:glutamyl-tRNA(Gln) amidotransferase subunit C, mitochondrial n=1 Tax=Planococcus citri TaxID=170843 RepID=UPI0031F73978